MSFFCLTISTLLYLYYENSCFCLDANFVLFRKKTNVVFCLENSFFFFPKNFISRYCLIVFDMVCFSFAFFCICLVSIINYSLYPRNKQQFFITTLKCFVVVGVFLDNKKHPKKIEKTNRILFFQFKFFVFENSKKFKRKNHLHSNRL